MPQAVPGDVHVSNEVLADLAGNAVAHCYGVVGMAAADAADSIATLLPQSRKRRGVVVTNTPEGIKVDMHVIIEYGTNINVVSQNVIEAVTFALTQYARIPLAGVDVHVDGIKVRK